VAEGRRTFQKVKIGAVCFQDRRMAQSNRKLIFRPAISEDLSFISAVELDEENAPLVGHETEAEHAMAMNNPDIRYWIAELQEDRQVSGRNLPKRKIGFGILKGVINKYRAMELGRIAMKVRNGGYGYQFIKFLQQVAFNQYQVHRLWLDVLTTNTRAIAVYEKAGFIREGCLRECSMALSGEYESLFIYALLAPEYANTNSI